MEVMKKLTIAILQARLSSKRLPGKVLMKINSRPMIYWQIKRILRSRRIDKLVVAISDHHTDNLLADYLESINQEYVRGQLDDVLSRFIKVERKYDPETIVRLTGDCPLVMPDIIDAMLDVFQSNKFDYLSNIVNLTFPDGLDIEIFRSGILEKLNGINLLSSEREHVTLGILERKNLFDVHNYSNAEDLSSFRWTVDTLQDFHFVQKVFEDFKDREFEFNFSDLILYFKSYPELNQIAVR
jgi:spore coat polysaccharide biosynthesis protein SpsF (cytidylyltransferase family)